MKIIQKITSFFLILTFGWLSVIPPEASAQMNVSAAVVGQTVAPSIDLFKGIKVYPQEPFKFDFIVADTGASADDPAVAMSGQGFPYPSGRRPLPQDEYLKLIKYFMASLTVPDGDLWVNLSPDEPDRIIPQALGQTEMGQEMLSQDYLLKKLTSSLMHPDTDIGRQLWEKIYQESYEKYGNTDIPVETFNRVWIVPDKAAIYQNVDTAYIVKARLKVMLEEDYLQQEQHVAVAGMPDLKENIKNILRAVLIPALEQEVNNGPTFASLRQIYHSLILAKWFKQNLRDSVLAQSYADQNKVSGIDTVDKASKDHIYNQYLQLFQQGAYSFIKEEYDPVTQSIIPRRYFSGGLKLGMINKAQLVDVSEDVIRQEADNKFDKVHVNLAMISPLKRINLSRLVTMSLMFLVGMVLSGHLYAQTSGGVGQKRVIIGGQEFNNFIERINGASEIDSQIVVLEDLESIYARKPGYYIDLSLAILNRMIYVEPEKFNARQLRTYGMQQMAEDRVLEFLEKYYDAKGEYPDSVLKDLLLNGTELSHRLAILKAIYQQHPEHVIEIIRKILRETKESKERIADPEVVRYRLEGVLGESSGEYVQLVRQYVPVVDAEKLFQDIYPNQSESPMDSMSQGMRSKAATYGKAAVALRRARVAVFPLSEDYVRLSGHIIDAVLDESGKEIKPTDEAVKAVVSLMTDYYALTKDYPDEILDKFIIFHFTNQKGQLLVELAKIDPKLFFTKFSFRLFANKEVISINQIDVIMALAKDFPEETFALLQALFPQAHISNLQNFYSLNLNWPFKEYLDRDFEGVQEEFLSQSPAVMELNFKNYVVALAMEMNQKSGLYADQESWMNVARRLIRNSQILVEGHKLYGQGFVVDQRELEKMASDSISQSYFRNYMRNALAIFWFDEMNKSYADTLYDHQAMANLFGYAFYLQEQDQDSLGAAIDLLIKAYQDSLPKSSQYRPLPDHHLAPMLTLKSLYEFERSKDAKIDFPVLFQAIRKVSESDFLSSGTAYAQFIDRVFQEYYRLKDNIKETVEYLPFPKEIFLGENPETQPVESVIQPEIIILPANRLEKIQGYYQAAEKNDAMMADEDSFMKDLFENNPRLTRKQILLLGFNGVLLGFLPSNRLNQMNQPLEELVKALEALAEEDFKRENLLKTIERIAKLSVQTKLGVVELNEGLSRSRKAERNYNKLLSDLQRYYVRDKDDLDALQRIRLIGEPRFKEDAENVFFFTIQREIPESFTEDYLFDFIFQIGLLEDWLKKAIEEGDETALVQNADHFVRQLNPRHGAENSRFEILDRFSADMILKLIVFAQDEMVVVGTYRKMLDIFFNKLEKDEKTFHEFMIGFIGNKSEDMQETRKNQLAIFFDVTVSLGEWKTFFSKVDNKERDEIIDIVVAAMGSKRDPRLRNVTAFVENIYRKRLDADILNLYAEEIWKKYQKAVTANEVEDQVRYGMLLNVIQQKGEKYKVKFDAEKDRVSQLYAFKESELLNFKTAKEEDLFLDGVNRQWHFFYSDEDGLGSYNVFRATYKDWKLEDKGAFIILKKTLKSRTIEMYVNKPGFSKTGPAAIAKLINESNLFMPMVVHRGHSPHLLDTLPYILPKTAVAILGSCGGARVVSDVVFAAINVQPLATRGTGTLRVNNFLLKIINQQILETGSINWDEVWLKGDRQFGKNDPDWLNYIKPSDNRTLQFIRQYRVYLDAEVNKAQLALSPKPTGGIDMNNVNLETSGKMKPLDISADSAMMGKMAIQGLVPQIISVNAVDLLGFLGIEDRKDETKKSSSNHEMNDGLSPMTKLETT